MTLKKQKSTTTKSKKDTEVSHSTPKKSKNRRNSDPLSPLEKKYTLKTRADLIDYDYIDKLSYEEKLWLAKFTSEEIHASVNKDGKKNKFNKKKKDIKRIFDSNNARNRCTWTQEKAKGMAQYLEDHKETLLTNNPEDYIITKIDLQNSGWIDESGEVIKTELEYIKEQKLQEKTHKRNKKITSKPIDPKTKLNNCEKPNCGLCELQKQKLKYKEDKKKVKRKTNEKK